jgi:gliding motility-associated-like protein
MTVGFTSNSHVCVNTPLTFTDTSKITSGGTIVQRIWNFGDGSAPDTITTTSVAHTYLTSNNYTVTLTVISNAGCSLTATNNITADSLPTLNTGQVTVTQPTCAVSTGSISVASFSTVTYSFNGGSSYQDNASSGAISSGNYNVIIKNNAGCVSATIPVAINAAPVNPTTPELSTTQPTCAVATGIITVTSPTSGVTYSFDGGNTYQASATSNALAPNTYNVVVMSTTGCVSAPVQATITAVAGTPATPVVTTTQPTCTVATGTITVTSPTSGVAYSFDGGNTYQAGATSNALNPNTYNVYAKNGSGCVSLPTAATITENAGTPEAPVTSVTQPTCTVATGTITVTSPTTGVTYSFDGGDTYQVSATSAALSPNNYTVMVKNSSGCTSSAQATISAAPGSPTTPVLSIIQPTCTIATGSITVTEQTGATYSFDGGNTFQSSNTSNALESGNYSIIVKSSSGCLSGTVPGIINAQPLTPNVIASADNLVINIGATVHLTGNATNVAATYMWTSTPSVAITNAESSTASSQPSETTTYTVTATTASDCVGSASVTVTVNGLPCTASPMRTFTPNGDGINDVWLIAKGDCVSNLEVNVYNRWGSLVYHSDNYNNDWNGTYQDKPLPDATYYYVVQVTYPSGLLKTLTGNVTIIR